MTDKPRKMHLQWKLREVLHQHSDGLEIGQLSDMLGSNRFKVRDALQKMPDAYIDRWHKEPGSRGRYASVWCVVEVPENCPMPNTEGQRRESAGPQSSAKEYK